jgi:hypothetical protein
MQVTDGVQAASLPASTEIMIVPAVPVVGVVPAAPVVPPAPPAPAPALPVLPLVPGVDWGMTFATQPSDPANTATAPIRQGTDDGANRVSFERRDMGATPVMGRA